MPKPPRVASRPDGLLSLALAAAVILLATSLVRITVTHFGFEPELDRLHAAASTQAQADRAMLAMQGGVRGYQLGADPQLLASYTSGLVDYTRAASLALGDQPRAQDDLRAAATAASAWQSYAGQAVAEAAAGDRPSATSLRLGERLFERYETARAHATASLSEATSDERSAEGLFRTSTGAAQALALLILAVALFRRQRRPADPLPATRRETSPTDQAYSDSDELAVSITRAARDLSGALAAHLWLAQDSGELRRVDPGQPAVAAQRRRHDVALRAHREGAITTSVSRGRRTVAVPLLHEGRTLGVVELSLPPGSGTPTNAQTEMLRAWGRQAARTVAAGPGIRDQLTGLAGRPSLLADVCVGVERCLADQGQLSLVLLAVDHLERYGEADRDELVRAVATVLTDTVRTTDTAYRTSEAGFAVLLPGATAQAAASLAERLRQIIARRFIERGLTASFGVATCPDAAQDEDALLEAAESALYDARRFGGNRIQPAQPLAEELALVRRRTTELD